MSWRGALVFLILSLTQCSGCPVFCSCKWKSGKQTVECINKDLLVIPEGMDSSTQVLQFCGNNLQTLQRDKFLKMDLINLQRIYLCRCRITSIDDRTFRGLTNLVELDLSGNLLETVPSETFLDCPSLMRLSLNANPIKTLRRAAFNHLSFLNTIELSNCEISNVEQGAFQGLYSLEWLHLNGNKMTTLQGATYLPKSLKGVQLQENPWECDCHILELHAWLRAFTMPHSVEPLCNGPTRLRSRTIKSVPVGELACLPEVSPTMFYLEIGEGKNVTLLCQVNAIPEARISWTFQGQLLQNDSMIAPGVHLLYFIEEGAVEKRSELFIYNSNSDDNGTFICNAENAAGLVQANFTIRVIVKHDTPPVTNELPFEFILITLSAAAVSILLLLVVILLSIIKCHRNARLKKKRNNSKAALSNTTKDNLLQESVDDYSEKPPTQEEETMLYNTPPEDLPVSSIPPTLTPYQLEQNPDLINGTESVGRFTPLKKRDLYVYAPDVHLNPVGLLNSGSNCYKTLPYNRNKRSNAANPAGRFSREAEFLQRTMHPSYEHYSDVRYTADGYPVRTNEGAVEPCCSTTTTVSWPSCVPASFVAKDCVKSVGAQTEDTNTKCEPIKETFTESLDEGYEGEGAEVHTNGEARYLPSCGSLNKLILPSPTCVLPYEYKFNR
ncbi:Leucine-rich repeat-containing protein 4B-like Protein [Tribolium castaneum]|uniref:Leucine-rich repeat-containing protein 4B-like Protein n=1 Tax=Tribolium castaneum TaxID=7070 RepID=D2A219_TRICA|nr:Leucine-rich repeat-containing protein 4B-like Protein [Tribolium castaneum]